MPALSRLTALATALFVFGITASAHAIPAFARRYQTSCQTCHLAFPRLTPFGEAFRRNGFRFPGGGDATAEKQEPIALGNDAMKEQWPKAVWPGELPGILPLSLVVDGKASYGPMPEGHMTVLGSSAKVDSMGMPIASAAANNGKASLDTMGGHVGMRAGGSIGEIASVFASVDVGGHEPISVERGWLNLTPLGATALHVRMGRFEPTLHGVSIHRGIYGHQLRLTTTSVGNNPAMLEPNKTGIELSGVAIGRIGWALGAVDNAIPDQEGAVNQRLLRKDFYGRAEYKLGGMRLDGLDAQAGSAAWRERSILVGASAYSGKASIEGAHFDDFLRAGADVHVIFDDILLDVVAAREHHDQPTLAAGQAQDVDLLFGELTWVTSAFAFPSLRAEASRNTHDNKVDTAWLGTALASFVVRPNILLRLQGEIGKDATTTTDFRSASFSFATAF